MDRISITGLQATGHHGVLAHERRHGQRFVVDAHLEVDLHTAGHSDRLEDTVDYGRLVGELEAVLTGPAVDLLETLAQRLADRCLADDRVVGVEVTVHKPAAPVPALVHDVSVTIRRVRP